MPVSALTQFDPSKFFQAPVADPSRSQRLDTKVSAVSAAADLNGRLSVTTAEGDKIMLTADFEARYRAVNYQARTETEQGTVEVNATSIEASLKKQYGVTVEGDLNEQELHDLETLFRKEPVTIEWIGGFDQTVDPRRADAFYAEIRRYWPALGDGALQPAYSGIRPKISGPGEPAADFRIDGPRQHGVPGLVNLFGIESPGLTASLAIADHVCALLAA